MRSRDVSSLAWAAGGLLSVLLLACGSDDGAAADSGAGDVTTGDSGASPDSQAQADTGSQDSGPGANDSSSPDTGVTDATVADGSSSDAATDAPPPGDSATPDAGEGGVVPLAVTPPMGWNSWNTFGGGVTEELIKGVADSFVSSGLAAAGYQYVNIDDGWAQTRDGSGNIVVDATKFPSGMTALAAYVHAKGLKLGIYTCAGTSTCQGLPGSYQHEAQDAKTYADWGIDYVKEDWCNTAGEDPATQYGVMRDAIKASGREMVFSICDWGVNAPWDWGPTTGNLWRSTGDIADNFASMTNNVDSTAEHASAAGPGHWNDPDMLEVGTPGLTDDESRAHFSLWAVLAAPLIAGNDVRSMTPATVATLTNAEVIAVDADPAGKQGTLVFDDGNGNQVYSKPLATPGKRAVVLFNRGGATSSITARWSDLGLAPGSATVRDLWQKADLGPFTDSFTASVASHAVSMVIVTGSEGPITQAPAAVYQAAAGTNTLTGPAVVASCTHCTTGSKVGWVGTTPASGGGNQTGTLQFNGVMSATAGMKTIVFQYITGENRYATVSVNGGPALTVYFGMSDAAGDFDSPLGTHVLDVQLNAGSNTILVSNPTAPAPDFAAIEVYP